MRIALCTLLLVLGTSHSVLATEQLPDIIIYNGVVYHLHTPLDNPDLPLETLWKTKKDRPRLSILPAPSVSYSACWRGYVAIWEVEKGGALVLKGLDAWQGKKRADLKAIFPERHKDGDVKADWFSGRLTLRTGGRETDKTDKVFLNFEDGHLQKEPSKAKAESPNK